MGLRLWDKGVSWVKISVFVAIILIIIAISRNMVLYLSEPLTSYLHNAMFTELSEFEKLDEFVIKEIEDNALLEGVGVTEKYWKKVRWNDAEYEVYATVFETNEDTSVFIRRALGGEIKSEYGSIFEVRSPRKRYYAWLDNKMYLVTGAKESALSDFVNWLCEDFSLPDFELERDLAELDRLMSR